jgi:protein-S-isoprenylcysteine O-methyltransferase Ste14
LAIFSFEVLVIFFGWQLYGLFHSLLASSAFKNVIEKTMPGLFKRYRFIFVISAILTPLPLLWFQVTHKSPDVWNSFREIRLLGGIMAGMGLALLRKAFAHYDSKLFLGLSQKREDSETFKSNGLLAKMRHPLYTAILMILWGWFLFSNSYNNLAFSLANTLYIFIGIQWEEKKLIKQYGQKYMDYKAKVPMLIPKIRP